MAWDLCSMLHLLGLAVGLGAATVKTALVMRAGRHPEFLPVLVEVSRPITHLIIGGLVLLTGSGIGFLVLGTDMDAYLMIKLGLVVVLWGLGPLIDNRFEPKLFELVRAAHADPAALETARKRHQAMELLATGTFYAVAFIGALL